MGPKKWEAKVMAIEEAKDLTKLPLLELIGSLTAYEIRMNSFQMEDEEKILKPSTSFKERRRRW